MKYWWKCNNNYMTMKLKEGDQTKLNIVSHSWSNEKTAIICICVSCEIEVCICFYMYVFFLFEMKRCYFNIESLKLQIVELMGRWMWDGYWNYSCSWHYSANVLLLILVITLTCLETCHQWMPLLLFVLWKRGDEEKEKTEVYFWTRCGRWNIFSVFGALD